MPNNRLVFVALFLTSGHFCCGLSARHLRKVWWFNYWIVLVYYLFKTATWCLGMVFNIIFDMFETFQISPKVGTSDPLFIADVFQKYKEIQSFLKLLCFISEKHLSSIIYHILFIIYHLRPTTYPSANWWHYSVNRIIASMIRLINN